MTGTSGQGSLHHRITAGVKLDGELARWRRLAIRPRLWWRDDDARAPGPALDRLLALADGRPLALAVIPDGDLQGLSARLANVTGVSIGQHGVDHTNRRPPGAVPSEYATPPALETLMARIGSSRDRMLAAGLVPRFYTPPWNAVDAGLPQALAQIGFPLLSAGGETIVRGDLPYLPAEVDVLSWKGVPRFKGGLRIMSALARALAARREAEAFDRPVGLLTHHLDHDGPTWRYLHWALPFLDRRFDWVDVTAPRTVGAHHAVERRAPRKLDPMARAERVW